MEFVFELVWSIVGELVIQIVAQLSIELGFHSVGEILVEKKDRNPYIAFIGYIVLGVIIGGISLGLYPELLIDSPKLALANLILTPILLGLLMAIIGFVLNKKGKRRLRLESFSYGYVFAFSIGLIRYVVLGE